MQVFSHLVYMHGELPDIAGQFWIREQAFDELRSLDPGTQFADVQTSDGQ